MKKAPRLKMKETNLSKSAPFLPNWLVMRKFGTFVSLALAGVFVQMLNCSDSSRPLLKKSDTIIQKSDIDRCSYRYIELANGLRATLISDP